MGILPAVLTDSRNICAYIPGILRSVRKRRIEQTDYAAFGVDKPRKRRVQCALDTFSVKTAAECGKRLDEKIDFAPFFSDRRPVVVKSAYIVRSAPCGSFDGTGQ